jgi:hypothetical protein
MHADRPPATDRHPDLTEHAPTIGGTAGSSRSTTAEHHQRGRRAAAGRRQRIRRTRVTSQRPMGAFLKFERVLSDTHPPPQSGRELGASADAFPSSPVSAATAQCARSFASEAVAQTPGELDRAVLSLRPGKRRRARRKPRPGVGYGSESVLRGDERGGMSDAAEEGLCNSLLRMRASSWRAPRGVVAFARV